MTPKHVALFICTRLYRYFTNLRPIQSKQLADEWHYTVELKSVDFVKVSFHLFMRMQWKSLSTTSWIGSAVASKWVLWPQVIA